MGIGRPKGSKGKASQHLMLARQACLEGGFEPFMHLVELAQQKEDLNLAFRATRELANYIQPKLQSIAHTGDMQESVQVILNSGDGR
jgi:hypothetical protein